MSRDQFQIIILSIMILPRNDSATWILSFFIDRMIKGRMIYWQNYYADAKIVQLYSPVGAKHPRVVIDRRSAF